MIPAPAQGAMVIVALKKDEFSIEATSKLNNTEADICTYIERSFLQKLEGGCTAPIGALATCIDDTIQFKGVLFSLDGQTKLEVAKDCSKADYKSLGTSCADETLANGGKELMAIIKSKIEN